MAYQIKLLALREIAEGTMTFKFEKPSGFEFKAGQSMDLTLTNPSQTDGKGNTRPFSIAAAPEEPELMIATRIRDSAFKRTLKTLTPGVELSMEGPFGSFTLHNDAAKPAVFLIGGIGITPIRSILVDAAKRKLSHGLFFYSNRRPEDAAFLDELANLQSENKNYKFIPTMTQIDKSLKPWSGETGYITEEMIKKYFGPDLDSAIYYMSGPQEMVKTMRKLLNDAGVNDDYIRSEEFTGY